MSLFNTKKDSAVSPVIGVMLMIVVTIIIGAVVAMFASGTINTTSAAPAVTFDAKVTKTSMAIEVLSASEQIPSKDLRIAFTSNGTTVTIEAKNKVDKKNDNRTPYGFHIVETTHANGFLDSSGKAYADSEDRYMGTSKQAGYKDNYNQWFGNYTLQVGTVMSASEDAFKEMIPQNPKGFDTNSWTSEQAFKDFLNVSTSSKEMWFSIFPGVPIKNETGTIPPNDYILALPINSLDPMFSKIAKFYSPALETSSKGEGTWYWFTASDHAWVFDTEDEAIYYKPNEDFVEVGKPVTITITHIPSNKILYTKSIIVEDD